MNKGIKLGIKTLKVKFHGEPVGTLALTNQGKAAFAYEESWIESGFSISPFSLPLEKKYLFRRKMFLMVFLAFLQTVFRMPGEDYCFSEC